MKKILIVAGEASGDIHAAKLIAETKKINPDVHFYGVGSDEMQKAGAEILIDNRKISVVGLTEVIAHFPEIYATFQQVKKLLQNNPPDLLILVDFPDFNLRLAKLAKKFGIKILYYISPTVWAWRKGRIKTIRKCIDKMAVILPFEKSFYHKENVAVSYVGHPLVSEVKCSLTKAEAIKHFGLDEASRIIGLLPGSRQGEIKRLLPIILRSAQLIKDKYPDIQFVLPLGKSIDDKLIAPYLQNFPFPIKVVRNDLYNAIQTCDAVIATSGTVTLEVGLLEVPHVIIYKFSWLSYFICGPFLLGVKFIGICNIILNKLNVKEFFQFKARPKLIVKEISKILDDGDYRRVMLNNLGEVKKAFLNEMEIEKIGEVVNGVLL